MIGDLTISGSPNNSVYAHHAMPNVREFSGRLKARHAITPRRAMESRRRTDRHCQTR